MTMEWKTKEFTINFSAPEMDAPLFHAAQHGGEPNYLEIYVRKSGKADKIPYGGAEERFKFADLKLVYRMALDIYPDPRMQIEDAKDDEDMIRMKSEQNAIKEQERIQQEAKKVAAIAAKKEALDNLNKRRGDDDDDDDMDGSEGGEGSHSDSNASGSGTKSKAGSGMKGSQTGQSGDGDEESDLENSDDEEEESEVQDDLHELPDEGEVREELIRAIMDELAEF